MKALIFISALIIFAALVFFAFLLVRSGAKKPLKPKRIIISSALCLPVLLLLVISAVCMKNAADTTLGAIAGEWECAETLAEDDSTYTGFLNMDISPMGRFSMYDAEAGNPAISGWIIRLSEKKLLLICTNLADFDPPPGWFDMGKAETVEFEHDSSKGALLLRYRNKNETATLSFSST